MLEAACALELSGLSGLGLFTCCFCVQALPHGQQSTQAPMKTVSGNVGGLLGNLSSKQLHLNNMK